MKTIDKSHSVISINNPCSSGRVEDADDGTQKYYVNISQYPLLKRKEEDDLFETLQKWSKNKKAGQKTRTNGKMAREKIINSNLRLVVKISKEYSGLGLPLLDLISEGNIGLMKAVDRFKLNKGTKFSTYAAFWIKQGMFKSLDNKARLIRIPSDANREYPKITAYINEQERLTGEKPSIKEIAKKFKTAEKRVVSIIEARQRAISIDEPVSDDTSDNGSMAWGERIADAYNKTPEVTLELKNNKEILNKLLKKLSRRERNIIIRRWGIDDKDSETLESIGNSFRVTRERIRQIEANAVKKLRMMVRTEFSFKIGEKENDFSFRF